MTKQVILVTDASSGFSSAARRNETATRNRDGGTAATVVAGLDSIARARNFGQNSHQYRRGEIDCARMAPTLDRGWPRFIVESRAVQTNRPPMRDREDKPAHATAYLR